MQALKYHRLIMGNRQVTRQREWGYNIIYKINSWPPIYKKVSEYNQEIPQSKTADKPVTSCGRATQQSRDTRKTNKAKQPALSSPSR